MEQKVDLSGIWNFALADDTSQPPFPLSDTISLPGTTSCAGKGTENTSCETGHLTERYPFKGRAWYSRTLDSTRDLSRKHCSLFLERTRITTVYLDGKNIGTQNSLCTPHEYDLSGLLPRGTHTLTVCVDNASYPTNGGHMTSPDTQTNWNGITGSIELRVYPECYADGITVIPDAQNASVTVRVCLHGADSGTVTLSADCFNGVRTHTADPASFPVRLGENTLRYNLGTDACLWSEHEPNLYRLTLTLDAAGTRSTEETVFGLRDFSTKDGKFTINGQPTFLRGKHEALIFPRTGYTPATVGEWLTKLRISQEYGINHYRFHTCCPPDAAFTAADMLGVYMEPELPFWGTIPEENDPNADPAEWNFLKEEGFRILRTFANHPSFVMLSLGNELWGSRTHLDSILSACHDADPSRLYTQGSNNFQFCPEILPHEDFFCGVRFSRTRLIRGSYAACDAPLGHVQTGVQGTLADYDDRIAPLPAVSAGDSAGQNGEKGPTGGTSGGKITIQFGTGIKTVSGGTDEDGPVPSVPVVSHEIGQYAVYPDFSEIEKYTGPLKARNLETFRRRLEARGLGSFAEAYFRSSGKLAAACYKEELEAAFRSKQLAGFQLLDLQDYSGQGTALVGMLNAFMESKGLISPEEWRTFCADAVLLARFDRSIYVPRDELRARIQIRFDRPDLPEWATVVWELKTDDTVFASGCTDTLTRDGDMYEAGSLTITMPETDCLKKFVFSLECEVCGITKTYDLWLCPSAEPEPADGLRVFDSPSDELNAVLIRGERAVLFMPPEAMKDSLEGTYCTDFWCYPMFRSISESMHKPVPAGTMGLLIRNTHPALKRFPCQTYSTEQWRNIVTASRALVLDGTPQELVPIVQVIDNFERNHKLGILFECRVNGGSLLVCTCPRKALESLPEGRVFLSSILSYARSNDFRPAADVPLSAFSL